MKQTEEKLKEEFFEKFEGVLLEELSENQKQQMKLLFAVQWQWINANCIPKAEHEQKIEEAIEKAGKYRDVNIEMKRYGVPNEFYTHIMLGQCRSNTWVDVPVQSSATETLHEEMEDVAYCVVQSVDLTSESIMKYRLKDIEEFKSKFLNGEK